MTLSCRRSSVKLNLDQKVQDAIHEATAICARDPSSPECRVAWDIVEELEARQSHQGSSSQQDPNAVVSTDLVAFLASFDILSQKINGKMDQLKATTDRLQELGATDQSFADVGMRAEDMKDALARARNDLSRYL